MSAFQGSPVLAASLQLSRVPGSAGCWDWNTDEESPSEEEGFVRKLLHKQRRQSSPVSKTRDTRGLCKRKWWMNCDLEKKQKWALGERKYLKDTLPASSLSDKLFVTMSHGVKTWLLPICGHMAYLLIKTALCQDRFWSSQVFHRVWVKSVSAAFL